MPAFENKTLDDALLKVLNVQPYPHFKGLKQRNGYFRYENGVMALIEASPSGYNLNGSFRIGINNGKSWAHPVIADGKLYLREQDKLMCYSLR